MTRKFSNPLLRQDPSPGEVKRASAAARDQIRAKDAKRPRPRQERKR